MLKIIPKFVSEPDYENISKVVIDLLNSGDCCNTQELYSLLSTEQKNEKDMSDIIKDVWPKMISDKARHNLCEALVKTDVKPHMICEQIYTPWVSE